jgi:hypothetical protein
MSAAQSIPEPRADDDDDVHFALTTATTLLARGDREEALKWLRRAAEAASDANHDKRSLELFKAAGDFSAAMRAGGPAAPAAASPPQPSAAGPGLASAHPHAAPPHAAHPHASTIISSGSRDSMSGASRSNPPPPPRGRGQGSLPSDRPSPRVSTGPASIEPMAPTVPQPRSVGPDLSPARGPFVPTANSAGSQPGGLPKNARTLASAGPIDLKDPSAAQAMRAAVTKAQSLTDAAARQQSRTTRQLQGTLITKDPPPPSSPPAGTAAAKPPSFAAVAAPAGPAPAPTVPDKAGTSPVASSPARAAARTAASAQPQASSAQQQPQQAPLSRGRRRTTLGGRRNAGAPTGGQPRPEPQTPERAPISSRPRERTGGGFEDEITAIRDFSLVKAELAAAAERAAAAGGGIDLDEHTNVLDGTEVGVEVVAGGGPESHESTDPGTSLMEHPQVPPTEAFPVTRAAADLGVICAYRVGFALDPLTGRLDVVTLAPGEPPPTGRLAAIVVPTDVATSAALAELFARVRDDGERRRKS